MVQKIAVYNNTTGVAKKLELLCMGEEIRILVARSQEELIHFIKAGEVQMVLLDIMMEERGFGEGINLITAVRSFCRLPIIVVSGQKSEMAKVSALSVGADDYVCADDNPLVLLARIKSQLRRFLQLSEAAKHVSKIYRADDLVVDDSQRKVTVEGREVKLTPIEYQILKLLVMGKGKVFSINEIYEDIWRMQAIGADNTVAVHIRHIREKIEQNPRNPKYVKVVWGTGYMVG